jgi:hypothetical protein
MKGNKGDERMADYKLMLCNIDATPGIFKELEPILRRGTFAVLITSKGVSGPNAETAKSVVAHYRDRVVVCHSNGIEACGFDKAGEPLKMPLFRGNPGDNLAGIRFILQHPEHVFGLCKDSLNNDNVEFRGCSKETEREIRKIMEEKKKRSYPYKLLLLLLFCQNVGVSPPDALQL